MKGPYAGAVFVIGDRVSFGRASDSDVQILHPEVSRHHAKISVDASGNCVLVDLASDNGTTVNDVRIARHVLAPGDSFCIHKCIFMFDVAEGPVETSPGFSARVRSIESMRQTSAGLREAPGRRPFDPLGHRLRAAMVDPAQPLQTPLPELPDAGVVTREVVDVERVRGLSPRVVEPSQELSGLAAPRVPEVLDGCDTVVFEPSSGVGPLVGLELDLRLEPPSLELDGVPSVVSTDDSMLPADDEASQFGEVSEPVVAPHVGDLEANPEPREHEASADNGRRAGSNPRDEEDPLPPGLQGVPWQGERRRPRARPAALQRPWANGGNRQESSDAPRAAAGLGASGLSALGLMPLPRPGDARAAAPVHENGHAPAIAKAAERRTPPTFAIPWPDDALPYAPNYEPPMAAVGRARKPGRGNHAPRWQPSGVLHGHEESTPPEPTPLPLDSLEIELDQKVAGAASLTRRDEDEDETTRFRARQAAQRNSDSEILSISEKETLIVLGDILDFRTLRARKLQFGGLAAPDEERLTMLQQRLHGCVREQQVELRYAPRACTLDVRVAQPEPGRLRSTRVELIDLSAGQARVGRIDVPLRVGDAVWLTVDLSAVHISTRCLVFKSRVAWSQTDHERCGLLFVGAPQLVEDPERLILGTGN